MENTQLFVVAHYFAKPTMGDKVNDALRMLAEVTRNEPENITYEFFRSTEDGDRFVIVETYRCAQGLELHRQTEHFQRIGVGVITPLLERKEVKSFLVPPDEPRR
ncbi:MAG: putative quinol monooxygenase [Citrobacter sp.]|uniref:putative quinol monooxygenase n=1 Tax=Citrobacter sp. TaxID=1896336 RepID=UPI002FC66586